MKLQPHYSQSSRENSTLFGGTSPLACYKVFPPPPPRRFWLKVLTLIYTKRFDLVTSHGRPRCLHWKRWTPCPLAFQNTNMIGYRGFLAQLPALSVWYTIPVTTRQPFIIYIGYLCPTGFNLKYCYLSTELSVYLKKLPSFKEGGSYNF